MSLSEQQVVDLELLLQSSLFTQRLEQLTNFQTAVNLTGMELDALKFLILQKVAEDFASTANDRRAKMDFMQVASSARIYRTTLQLLQVRNTTPSTYSPSN